MSPEEYLLRKLPADVRRCVELFDQLNETSKDAAMRHAVSHLSGNEQGLCFGFVVARLTPSSRVCLINSMDQ